MRLSRICEVDNCHAKHFGKGYCYKHYYRFIRRYKLKVNSMKSHRAAIITEYFAMIPLGKKAKDGYAVVDTTFRNLDVYKWSVDTDGYAISRINGKMVKMHHMIVGKPPKSMVTDHINRLKFDNRTNNLRHVSYKVNYHNASRKGKYVKEKILVME